MLNRDRIQEIKRLAESRIPNGLHADGEPFPVSIPAQESIDLCTLALKTLDQDDELKAMAMKNIDVNMELIKAGKIIDILRDAVIRISVRCENVPHEADFCRIKELSGNALKAIEESGKS